MSTSQQSNLYLHSKKPAMTVSIFVSGKVFFRACSHVQPGGVKSRRLIHGFTGPRPPSWTQTCNHSKMYTCHDCDAVLCDQNYTACCILLPDTTHANGTVPQPRWKWRICGMVVWHLQGLIRQWEGNIVPSHCLSRNSEKWSTANCFSEQANL